jgi:hypothetical protein
MNEPPIQDGPHAPQASSAGAGPWPAGRRPRRGMRLRSGVRAGMCTQGEPGCVCSYRGTTPDGMPELICELPPLPSIHQR